MSAVPGFKKSGDGYRVESIVVVAYVEPETEQESRVEKEPR